MTSINLSLQVIKNKNKSNITYSISKFENTNEWRSINITGKLTACEGFISSEGTNYDKEVVGIDCATTVVITNRDLAEAVIEKCEAIYAARISKGDLNPAITLQVCSTDFKVTNTNMLATKITKVYVEANTSLADSNDRIKDSLDALKAFSNAKATIMSNDKLTPTVTAVTGATVSAARAGLSSVLTTIKKSVKTYM